MITVDDGFYTKQYAIGVISVRETMHTINKKINDNEINQKDKHD